MYYLFFSFSKAAARYLKKLVKNLKIALMKSLGGERKSSPSATVGEIVSVSLSKVIYWGKAGSDQTVKSPFPFEIFSISGLTQSGIVDTLQHIFHVIHLAVAVGYGSEIQ